MRDFNRTRVLSSKHFPVVAHLCKREILSFKIIQRHYMYFVLLHSWTDSRSLLHSVPCATSCGPTRSKTSATSEPQNTTLTIVSEVAHIFLGAFDFPHSVIDSSLKWCELLVCFFAAMQRVVISCNKIIYYQ